MLPEERCARCDRKHCFEELASSHRVHIHDFFGYRGVALKTNLHGARDILNAVAASPPLGNFPQFPNKHHDFSQ